MSDTALPAAVVEKIDGIAKQLENAPTKEDLQGLNTKLNDLEQAQKELKASHATGTKVYERVQDDPNRGFKHFGDFLSSVASAEDRGEKYDDRLLIVKSPSTGGSSVADGPAAGYTIPPGFNNTIWDGLSKDVDDLVSKTDSYTVSGESLEFLANAQTSRASGSRWGGVNAYWVAEADAATASAPKFRKVKVEPQEIAALTYITDKALKLSPVALGQYSSRALSEEIKFLSNNALVAGTGAGQPKGILTGTAGAASARVAVAKETGQAAATVVRQNVEKMFNRLHPRAMAGAAWYYNPEVMPQLQGMTMDVGTGGVPVFLPPAGVTSAPYGSLFGLPLIPLEYCKALGTEGDLILANWKGYLTGVRGGIESASSMHVRFVNYEMAFRFIYAIDGQPWCNAPLTPFNGSATLSHFVTLADRA